MQTSKNRVSWLGVWFVVEMTNTGLTIVNTVEPLLQGTHWGESLSFVCRQGCPLLRGNKIL